jgi:putative transposase
MPRSPRIDFDGAWHHVMNRGAGQDTIFTDTLDRVIFLELLADAARTNGTAVHAYCLMGNHFHLLLENLGGSVPATLQDLTSRFTRRRNARSGRDGPVFRGRYRSVGVLTDAHRLMVSRYIHLNPVLAGLCARAQDWHWSSAGAYLEPGPAPDWLTTAAILDQFAGTMGDNYARFLSDGIDPSTEAFYARERLGNLFAPPVSGTCVSQVPDTQ